LQTLDGALMQSNSGAIIADTFPPNSRGKAYGFSSMGWTIGSMLGIVLGGIVTTFIGWQFIFFINLPIGAIALILGLKYLKQAPKVEAKLDLGGMVLLASSLLLIAYGATSIASQGTSTLNAALFLLGAFLIPLFIAYENRLETPMVNLKAFKDRVLRNICLATFFVSVGYISVVFLIIMYLQGVRGLSPLNAALLLIPGYVIGSFFSPVMGRHSDKIGARTTATISIICLAAATLIYTILNQNSSLYIILVASAVSGLRHIHVFPRQQLRRHGKSKTRQLRQHLRSAKNPAERRHLRKLRSGNIGRFNLHPQAISFPSFHQHHKTLRRVELILHHRHKRSTLRINSNPSNSSNTFGNPRKRKQNRTLQLKC
jgi:MFS family permease